MSVAIVSPDNSTLRWTDMHNTSTSGVVNCVTKLDSFPSKRTNDGYEGEESHLLKVRHKITRAVNGVREESLVDGIYAVGQKAAEMTNGVSLTGIDKYMTDEYLTVLVSTALSRLYPNGNKHVRIAVTHPFDYSDEIRDYIETTVGGRYTVEKRDGTKAAYYVEAVDSFNETEGAIAFLSGSFGTLFNGGAETITIFDWGHRTLQKILVTVTRDGISVSFDTARTFDLGGMHYLELLARNIATKYKVELGVNADRVPQNRRLFNAMLTGSYPVSGDYSLDVSDMVKFVKDQAVKDFETIVGGTNSDSIIWVGGSSVFFAELVTAKIFGRGFKWGVNSILGATQEYIRFINLFGIRSMMLDAVNE